MRSGIMAVVSRARAAWLILGVVLTGAACADGTGPVSNAEPQILFLSTRDGATDAFGRPLKDIYRVGADGTGLTNLTHQPAWRYDDLSLSPDGNRLLFSSDRAGGCDIWVMDVASAAATKLTNRSGSGEDGCNVSPRWSPDGARIAFITGREADVAVYVMNADGSDPHNISHGVQEELEGTIGVIGWTPDGRVVFQATRAGGGHVQRRIHTVGPDGTGAEPLFDGTTDHSPAWSPDGTKIAFVSERDGNRRLYLMNADGSNARPLTSHGGDDRLAGLEAGTTTSFDYSPWSPDGNRIAFVVDRDGGWGIHVIDADGSNLRRLTQRPGFFNGWSPDGRRIAYTEYVNRPTGSSNDVLLINVASGVVVNLTDSPADDSDALWLR